MSILRQPKDPPLTLPGSGPVQGKRLLQDRPWARDIFLEDREEIGEEARRKERDKRIGIIAHRR